MILIIQAVLYPASASLNRREINKNVCWESFQLQTNRSLGLALQVLCKHCNTERIWRAVTGINCNMSILRFVNIPQLIITSVKRQQRQQLS